MLSDDKVAAVVASEPDGYMVATGGPGLLVPLAFRPTREAAEAELAARRLKSADAAVYALHRVSGWSRA